MSGSGLTKARAKEPRKVHWIHNLPCYETRKLRWMNALPCNEDRNLRWMDALFYGEEIYLGPRVDRTWSK